jgi:hypothetical protein
MQTYSSVKIQSIFLHYRLPLLADNGRKQNDFVYHLKIKNMKNLGSVGTANFNHIRSNRNHSAGYL